MLASIVFFGVLGSTGTSADEPDDKTALTKPASPDFVVNLVVITDDDFLKGDSSSWCFPSLDKAILKCRETRPATEIRLRTVLAGSPSLLNNNRPKVGTRRAVAFLCDSTDRVLGLCVGVPTPKQLLNLVEETAELSLIESLQKTDLEKLDNEDQERVNPTLARIRERVAARTIRHYRPLFEKIHPNQSIKIAAESLQQALEKDIGERFLLTGPTDYDRLTSTQQHAEAYRYWCDAMLPCIYRRQVEDVWHDLVPMVWNAETWRIEAERELLAQWHDEAISKGPVVLEILSDKLFLDQPTRITDQAKSLRAVQTASEREMELDAELTEAVAEIEYRKADLADLAAILQRRGATSLDILHGPSNPIRWVIFENKTEKPIALPKESRSRLMTIIDKITK